MLIFGVRFRYTAVRRRYSMEKAAQNIFGNYEENKI